MATKPNTKTTPFYHENVYAAKGANGKGDMRYVIAELLREPGNARHLDYTAPPQHLCGLAPAELWARMDEIEKAASTMTESYSINGTAFKRKQRKTSPILMVGIASYPGPYVAGDADQERWIEYVVEAMRDRFGDQLRAVYAHTDEPHYHLHCVIDDGGAPVKPLHLGHKAAAEAEAEGLSRREQQEAYKAAMSHLQDTFYGAVGDPMGWARLSEAPKPRRPRTQALADKAADLEEREAALAANRAKIVAMGEEWEIKARQKLDEIAALRAEARAELEAAREARAEAEALKAIMLETATEIEAQAVLKKVASKLANAV